MSAPVEPASALLDVRDLSVRFVMDDRVVEAARGVSFRVARGETLAIVGESGSGKSVTALALTRLLPEPPAEIVSGRILLDGIDVLQLGRGELRAVRGGRIAYIFQEPSTSLNPVFTIRNQIAEALRLHRPEVRDVDAEVVRWLAQVGIVEPEKRMRDYPHQLSGGMQQRAMIAMALCCRPQLLVADEPTTALDVTIQAQILELLRDLRRRIAMSILLITHNFGIVRGLADRVVVMHRGEIVEQGDTEAILSGPRHPYTRALIECIPQLGHRRQRLLTIAESMARDAASGPRADRRADAGGSSPQDHPSN